MLTGPGGSGGAVADLADTAAGASGVEFDVDNLFDDSVTIEP
jgi:hypothetical protein